MKFRKFISATVILTGLINHSFAQDFTTLGNVADNFINPIVQKDVPVGVTSSANPADSASSFSPLEKGIDIDIPTENLVNINEVNNTETINIEENNSIIENIDALLAQIAGLIARRDAIVAQIGAAAAATSAANSDVAAANAATSALNTEYIALVEKISQAKIRIEELTKLIESTLKQVDVLNAAAAASNAAAASSNATDCGQTVYHDVYIDCESESEILN